MAGLLYKDFVAVKGKIYVFVSVLVLLLALGVRIVVPAGEIIDALLFGTYFYLMIILYMVLIYKLQDSMVAIDEGKRQKHYFLSLPVSKRQYVASKYVFLLIAFYFVLSLGLIFGMICQMKWQTEASEQMMNMWTSVLPILACMMLMIPAIELPFFIGCGTKRGRQVKIGFYIGLFFLSIVWLLFGNLHLFDQIGLVDILAYLNEHREFLLAGYVILPYVSLGLYYLSYRISCVLFEKRRWEDD